MKFNYFLAVMLFAGINLFAADNYYFDSDEKIWEFVDAHTGSPIAVNNLTVTGEIHQATFNALAEVITEVEGAFTLIDLSLAPRESPNDPNINIGGVGNLEHFMVAVPLRGSLIFRDCPYINWFRQSPDENVGIPVLPAVINGDLIIDGLPIPFPGVHGWASYTSFGDIEEVKGDLIIASRFPLQSFNDECFMKLKKVGGDFKLYMTGCDWIWSVTAPRLTYVGGDFELIGPEGGVIKTPEGDKEIAFWGLDILKTIDYIGGNVKIINFPRINLSFGGGDPNHPTPAGYCYVRFKIDTEVINYACKDVLLGWENEPVNLETLGGCFDGGTMDTNPVPLPAKDPDCASGIHTPVAAAHFATAYFANGNLTVDTKNPLKSVEIYSLVGVLISRIAALPVGINELSVENLPAGMSLIKMTGAEGKVLTSKVIIVK